MTDRDEPGAVGSTSSCAAPEARSTAEVVVACTIALPVLERLVLLDHTSIGSLSTGSTAATTPPRLLPSARGPDPRGQEGGGVQPAGPAGRNVLRTANSGIDGREQQGGTVVLPPPPRVASSSSSDGGAQQSGGGVVASPPGGEFSEPAFSTRRTTLNAVCSKCNRNPGFGNVRRRLCSAVSGCPRWVCRDTCNKNFNKGFEKRCCACHPEIKGSCQCKVCSRKETKRSPDTRNERNVRANVAEQRGGNVGRRGRRAARGRGSALAGRYTARPQPTPAPRGFSLGAVQQRGGNAGWRGRSVGRGPRPAPSGRFLSRPRHAQAPRIIPASALRLPTANNAAAGSITVSLCVSSTLNRVVTTVNPKPPATLANQDQESRSSCSRMECYRILLNGRSVSQTAVSNGGVPSATGGMCRHAQVALQLLGTGRVKDAELVSFSEGACAYDDFKDCVAQASERKLLSSEDAATMFEMVALAEEMGVWFLVKLGDWGYAMLEARTRNCELDWAQVKVDNPEIAGSSRRITPGRGLMCKANRGNPCTEYATGKRRCFHTLVVALACWREQGMQDAVLYAGEEVVGGNLDNGLGGTQRTAQKQLDENPGKYYKCLANCLNLMSTHRFPEQLPLDLPPAAKATDRTYTTSQETCSGCVGEFTPLETVHATRITTEPRMMESVLVERRECKSCGLYAWASDNWRTTGLFNYNNSYLVEIPILYDCLEAFSKGVPISTFFELFLTPLKSKLKWKDANPELASRLTTGTNLFNMLTNIFLSFLALVDFTFEFRCWLWGKFPQIVTFDGCMKVACNFVSKGQVAASRPDQTVDTDRLMLLLKLSLLSPIYFGGVRVQFVVGAGETVGNSPAWVSPELRVSERFHKSQRGALQGDDDGADDEFVKGGNGALLIELLHEKKMGIDNVSAMNSVELKQLMKACWPDGGTARFATKEPQAAILKKLHAFWDSDGNPHRGSCSKMFLSRERGVTEGVFAAFTPAKVVVMTKVLLSAESPREMSDMVRAMQQKPDLAIYDAGCLAVPHLERDCPGVLKDRGRPPRLGDGERKEGGDEGGGEGGDDEQAVHSEQPGGVENVEPKRGRVCIPSIAYLASNSNSAGVDVPSCVLPTEPEINSASDVYALKTASEPTRVQSQLNVHDLLWAAGEYLGRVANLCNLAATRALAVLFREGVRVLSVFEVLVFTYHWLRRAAKDGARTSVLRADGWTLQGDSPAEVPVQGGGGDGPGDIVSNEAAAEHLGVLLVVSVGARNGKRPTLPKLDGVDVLVDNETSKVFSTLLDGLRAYSQAKTRFLVSGLGADSIHAEKIAESAIRCGIGGGDGVFSMKALQIALSADVVPHKSAEDGLVAGYSAIWQDTSFANSNLRHFRLWSTGMFVGPDGPHEKNHSEKCQRAYSGFSGCLEIAGVNLNPHEQDHSKKPIYFRSINTMNFPNFTFALRVINERQNQGYNRQTLDTLLATVEEHPIGRISSCEEALWRCGRCFCTNPVMRVFDCLGRVDVVFLSAVLAQSV